MPLFEIELLGIEKILQDAIQGIKDECALSSNDEAIVEICIISSDRLSYEQQQPEGVQAALMMRVDSLERVLWACNAKARYTKRAHSEAMDILEMIKRLASNRASMNESV